MKKATKAQYDAEWDAAKRKRVAMKAGGRPIDTLLTDSVALAQRWEAYAMTTREEQKRLQLAEDTAHEKSGSMLHVRVGAQGQLLREARHNATLLVRTCDDLATAIRTAADLASRKSSDD